VGVYSAFRYMVAVQREKTTFEQMALFFSWADLIILEGGKTTDYPKIEVVRAQISKGPDLKIDNRLLTATDLAGEPHWGRLVGLDDHYAIAAAIEDYLLRSWRGD
jgi:molybdopterin-guanine dinucleotide biosynthesis protein